MPDATLRIGHYQEPFNLEEIDNDQDYTFMERGLPDAFAPSYQIGIMAYHPILDQHMTWWAGFFRATDNPETLQDNGTVSGSSFGYSQFDGGYDATVARDRASRLRGQRQQTHPPGLLGGHSRSEDARAFRRKA